jgi:phosphoesterase RecJ-like protein
MITKIIDGERIQSLHKKIEKSSEIVIVTHLSPDGDAIGSSLGFAHFLKFLKKKVTIIVPNALPGFLKWLPESQQIINYQEQQGLAERLIASTNLIIALDFNELQRIGDMASLVEKSPAYKILIDHHLNPSNFADLIISYPQMSSTSEMIFRIICRMGHFTDISEACAECIYTGMMTDTGAFTYNSNSPETYDIVSELIKIGINKDKIYDKVYNNFTADRFRLMGYALNEKMKIYPEYGTALISLTLDELNRFYYKRGDTEGFVNVPLSIKGIVFSVFVKEDTDKIKLSFRSRGLFPVNQFASNHFGGGGHLNASGGESYISMAETIEKFERILPQYGDILVTEKEMQEEE